MIEYPASTADETSLSALIFDQYGRQIKVVRLNTTGKTAVDISGLPAGIYLLRIGAATAPLYSSRFFIYR